MAQVYVKSLRLSGPSAGAAVGVAAGVADAIHHAFSVQFEHSALEALPIIFTSVVICMTVGVICNSERLGRLRWIALTAAGPGIVALSGGSTAFRRMSGWSLGGVLIAWVVAILLVSIPLSFIPLQKTRHLLRYAAAALLGIGVLIYSASGVRLTDWSFSNQRPAAGARNVILIFLDTVRADDALGSPAPAMPHLAKFASSSINFSNAWSPASWTVPAHFAVLTGANWWRLPGDQHLGFQYQGPHLAGQFRLRGYDTAAIFANPQLSAEMGFRKGFDEFTTSRQSGVCHSALGDLMFRVLSQGGPRMPLCSWFIASEVTARATRFIRRAHRPYMLAVNYLDAHEPYYVPPECRPSGFQPITKTEREALMAEQPAMPSTSLLIRARSQYRAAMSCMDRSLARLLETAAGDPNAVIAIVGDHGEEFFEHGHGSHGFTVYRESIHVPLILRVPELPPRIVTEPVSTTDLFNSLLRAAHVSRGDATLPLLDEKQRRPVISTYELLLSTDPNPKHGYSVVAGNYHFILWRGGREVLYDDQLDPAEARPIPPESLPEIADPMRQRAVRVARDKQRAMQFSAVGYMR